MKPYACELWHVAGGWMDIITIHYTIGEEVVDNMMAMSGLNMWIP